MSGFAWVTLATNDSYSLGALVLAHSLRQVGTTHQLAVLVTPGVTGVMREKLASVFNVIKEVNILDSRDEANLRLLQRPDLGITFTKLHCWRLTQYSKCVFLDADTLVLQNADELFEREEFSAAPDVGWPDCFNSGVFVYRPSEDTYGKLIQFALEKGSFDGGDQGLLNLYFSDWAHKDISKHLPFIYNMCSTACYSYLPAFKQFGGNVKIIHFIGNAKPWLQYFDTESRQVQVTPGLQHLNSIVQHWWNIFCSLVHPALSTEMTRSRAPAVHYASFHSDTRSVPFPNCPITYFNISNEITCTDNKNYQNVWDPWDDYERRDESSVVKSAHTEHTEESSQHSDDNTNKSFAQNKQSIESCQPSNTSGHDTDSGVKFLSESQSVVFDLYANNNSTTNSEKPSNFSSGNFKSYELENYIHSQPVQESSNLKTSLDSHTTVVQTPSECNQLAWPHECAPASCVTNENALHVSPSEVNNDNAGLAGAFAQLTLGVPRTAEQSILEDHLRRQGWEVGNIDYMGRDSFDNIWSKICETLAGPSAPPPSEPVAAKPAEIPPAADSSPSAVPAEPQQVPVPVKSSEIQSVPTEPPAAVAAVEPKLEAVPQSDSSPQVESKSAEVPKPQETCPKPSVAESEPSKPAAVPPTESSAVPIPECKLSKGPPTELPKETAQPIAAPDSAKPETTAPAPAQEPKVPSPEVKAAVTTAPEKPAEAPPKPQQTPPSTPSPKTPPKEAAAPEKPVAAPAPAKLQQTPPSSPSPKTQSKAAPELQKPVEPPKAQPTPPSSPSPKPQSKAPPLKEAAKPSPQVAPEPAKQTEAAPPKPQPKAKEAAATPPESPTSAQPKEKSAKKSAAAESSGQEKPPSEEASGGQGPTPPPRKTGGAGGGTKKGGKGKK